MRIAITGGTGFVGRHLARRLVAGGHEVVLISRGVDARDPAIRELPGASFKAIGISDVAELTEAFAGCEGVAHLGGINREIGDQTYRSVHVQGTRNVIEAAKAAGVGKVILLSFLRARPDCRSGYHESKWAAEEIVRASGLDYTVFKAGVIYGPGDHMLDHLSHALRTFPVFMLVGYRERRMRPLAVQDLVAVIAASLIGGRLSRQTVAITGPEEITLAEAVQRVAGVVGRKRLTFRVPLGVHYALAWLFERTMKVPLAAKAQVRILSESLVEPVLAPDPLPADLQPRTPFSEDQIRKGLPEPTRFGFRDCIWSR